MNNNLLNRLKQFEKRANADKSIINYCAYEELLNKHLDGAITNEESHEMIRIEKETTGRSFISEYYEKCDTDYLKSLVRECELIKGLTKEEAKKIDTPSIDYHNSHYPEWLKERYKRWRKELKRET